MTAPADAPHTGPAASGPGTSGPAAAGSPAAGTGPEQPAPDPRTTAPKATRAPDRAAARAARREFRPARKLPAAITAAVLAAGALLALAEVVSGLLGRPVGVLPTEWLTRLGRDTRWEDPLTFTVAGLAGVIGVLLIWFAVWPGRSPVVPLASGKADDEAGDDASGTTVLGITRPGLRRDVAQAATAVDGVTRARVTVGRRRVRVQARTMLHDPGGLADPVHRAVSERLTALGLLRPVTVHVTVHPDRKGPG